MAEEDRFLICGYHGFGNIGDESILEAMICKLKEKFADNPPEIVVFSNRPGQTEDRHDVSAVNRWSPIRVLRELYLADLFISGGGGLLQDATSRRSLWYYWFSLLGALFTRTPFVVLGQGIGPIDSKLGRSITGFFLRRAGFLLVRDQRSMDFLRDQGIGEEKIIKGLDLAFANKNESERRRIFSPSEGSRIGVVLRNRVPSRQQVLNTVANSLDALFEEKGLDSVLFSTHPSDDRPMLEDLREKMEIEATLIDTDHLKGADLVELMRGLDLVIAGRLHAMIFSMLARTPCVAITYDRKMEETIEALSTEEISPEIKSWRPGELYQADLFFEDLLEVFSSASRMEKKLEELVPRIQRRAEIDLEEAVDRLDGVIEDGS